MSEELEAIEKEIEINELEDKRISKELRWIYFKIQSLESRSDNWETELVQTYDKILSKYEKIAQKAILYPINRNNITKTLMIDLKSLYTDEDINVQEYIIDGWIIDATVAVYEWSSIAVEKIMKELEDTISMMMSPEEILLLFEWLWNLLKKPVELIELIVEWLKQQWNRIVKDLEVLRDITTRPWFVIETMKYITAVWIPLLISLLWPWKMLRLLKLDKILPDSLMNKIDWKSKEEYDDKKELPDYLDMKYFENPNLSLLQVEKAMKTVVKSMDVKYLEGNPDRIERVMKTLDGMIIYLEKNDSKIKWMPKWLALDFKDNMIELKAKLDIVMSSKKINNEDQISIGKVIEYLGNKSREIEKTVDLK